MSTELNKLPVRKWKKYLILNIYFTPQRNYNTRPSSCVVRLVPYCHLWSRSVYVVHSLKSASDIWVYCIPQKKRVQNCRSIIWNLNAAVDFFYINDKIWTGHMAISYSLTINNINNKIFGACPRGSYLTLV